MWWCFSVFMNYRYHFLYFQRANKSIMKLTLQLNLKQSTEYQLHKKSMLRKNLNSKKIILVTEIWLEFLVLHWKSKTKAITKGKKAGLWTSFNKPIYNEGGEWGREEVEKRISWYITTWCSWRASFIWACAHMHTHIFCMKAGITTNEKLRILWLICLLCTCMAPLFKEKGLQLFCFLDSDKNNSFLPFHTFLQHSDSYTFNI